MIKRGEDFRQDADTSKKKKKKLLFSAAKRNRSGADEEAEGSSTSLSAFDRHAAAAAATAFWQALVCVKSTNNRRFRLRTGSHSIHHAVSFSLLLFE